MEGDVRKILFENSVLLISFFSPFAFAVTLSDFHPGWGIMAPLWIYGVFNGNIVFGFTIFMLIGFMMWIPYVFIGIEFQRLAKAETKDWNRFAIVVLVATAFAIVQIIWTSLRPTGGTTENPRYTLYVPLPIASVVALILSRRYFGEEEVLW